MDEGYALSDCINWDTNALGDCGGRVENVSGIVICETCRNRDPRPKYGINIGRPQLESRKRPNSNYVLQLMRDDDIAYDPWGTAMSWAFAVAENLAYVGADVPAELEYQPSIAGPILEGWPDYEISEWLGIATGRDDDGTFTVLDRERAEVWDADMEAKISELQFAGRCLSRYLDWCKASGKDY